MATTARVIEMKRIYISVISIALIACAYPLVGQNRGRSDPWPEKKKLLLVADVQTGYHHDSLNTTRWPPWNGWVASPAHT